MGWEMSFSATVFGLHLGIFTAVHLLRKTRAMERQRSLSDHLFSLSYVVLLLSFFYCSSSIIDERNSVLASYLLFFALKFSLNITKILCRSRSIFEIEWSQVVFTVEGEVTCYLTAPWLELFKLSLTTWINRLIPNVLTSTSNLSFARGDGHKASRVIDFWGGYCTYRILTTTPARADYDSYLQLPGMK